MKFSNNYNLLVKFSSIFPIDINLNSSIHSLKEKLISKPVFIYNNPVKSRSIKKKDLFNKSGIYMWYNNVNGKCYIESGVNLYKRISNYYKNAYLKRSYSIVNIIKKYGLNSFTLIILEIIEKLKDDSNSRLLRLNREDYYLLRYLPEYNILEKGTSSLNYKHTIEGKAKIRLAALKRDKNTIIYSKEFLYYKNKNESGNNNPMYGKKWSNERRLLMSKPVLFMLVIRWNYCIHLLI